ncbi:hypothetical protein GCM10009526_31770 [Glutamicibacter creatinolyticus]
MMSCAKTGEALLRDAEMEADCDDILVASASDFSHYQPGSVHRVLFGVSRYFLTSLGSKGTADLQNIVDALVVHLGGGCLVVVCRQLSVVADTIPRKRMN